MKHVGLKLSVLMGALLMMTRVAHADCETDTPQQVGACLDIYGNAVPVLLCGDADEGAILSATDTQGGCYEAATIEVGYFDVSDPGMFDETFCDAFGAQCPAMDLETIGGGGAVGGGGGGGGSGCPGGAYTGGLCVPANCENQCEQNTCVGDICWDNCGVDNVAGEEYCPNLIFKSGACAKPGADGANGCICDYPSIDTGSSCICQNGGDTLNGCACPDGWAVDQYGNCLPPPPTVPPIIPVTGSDPGGGMGYAGLPTGVIINLSVRAYELVKQLGMPPFRAAQQAIQEANFDYNKLVNSGDFAKIMAELTDLMLTIGLFPNACANGGPYSPVNGAVCTTYN